MIPECYSDLLNCKFEKSPKKFNYPSCRYFYFAEKRNLETKSIVNADFCSQNEVTVVLKFPRYLLSISFQVCQRDSHNLKPHFCTNSKNKSMERDLALTLPSGPNSPLVALLHSQSKKTPTHLSPFWNAIHPKMHLFIPSKHFFFASSQ